MLHEWAFYAAIPLGITLGLVAHTGRGQAAAAVFAATVVAMFGASALYHRVTWSPEARVWLRRLDHVGIFGMIAGSYTPFGLLVLRGDWQVVVLAVVWAGALSAMVTKLVWPGGPKWLSAVFALALGWVAIVVFPQLLDRLGPGPTSLVAAGGLCYTLGALVYAFRKPDPFPRTSATTRSSMPSCSPRSRCSTARSRSS